MIDRGDHFPNKPAFRDPSLDRERQQLEHRRSGKSQLKHRALTLVGEPLAAVEHQIRKVTQSRFQELSSLGSQAAEMGGKRLRPILALLAAHACCRHPLTASQRRDLIRIATSVELVHAASLVHDDVMDSAIERRHRPTTACTAGTSTAILLGDFLFTKAYANAANCRSGYPARQIAKAATQLCEGELRQQLSVGRWDISLGHYRSILAQKTGALCAVSCHLGAWTVGATTEQVRSLKKFGQLLGIAFQVFDDWLDYWGTEDVGKTLGTDLAQGKPTLPLIRLLATLSDDARNELVRFVESGDSKLMQTVKPLLDRSDAREFTLALARRCVSRSLKCLDVLPESEAKVALQEIAMFSVARGD